jgi:hypothetical protein
MATSLKQQNTRDKIVSVAFGGCVSKKTKKRSFSEGSTLSWPELKILSNTTVGMKRFEQAIRVADDRKSGLLRIPAFELKMEPPFSKGVTDELYRGSQMNNDRNEVGIEYMFHALSSPRWIAMMFILPLLAVAHFALAQTTGPGTTKFDHIKTGFNLTGPHATAPCESCHVQGVFKGTPRDCASCHSVGNRMGASAKPSGHIPTVAPCDSCHRPTTWTPATFSHVGVAPGACLICHNSTTAAGKPSGHVFTSSSCDTCHRTTAWIPAGYDHRGVVPGTCATCHNGTTATGKSSGHIVTSAACDSCHTTTTWLGAMFNHTGVVPGTCATCHNGTTATGKTSGHVATTLSCDSCHTTTTWLGAGFNHIGVVPGTCATCHNGTTAKGVGGGPTTSYPSYSGHVPTTYWPSCDNCHKSTTSFLNAKVHGSGASVTGQCNICHSKHNNSQSCDQCHSTSTWNK